MKFFSWLLIVCVFLLVACTLQPPNKSICYTDGPSHANCAFLVQGNDFSVDNQGHNFTQDGRNWNYTELLLNSLILPPDTAAAEKQFFLNFCHQNPNDCNYSQALERFNHLKGLK